MCLLLFALAMLVMIDHFIKYKPQDLIFYKNAHQFSIIVAVLQYHPHIEKMIDYARKSKHQFIFVSVNYALDPTAYDDIKIIEIEGEFTLKDQLRKTPILSRAYHVGYQEATENFICFINAELDFKDFKTIDHMANNIVEHQVYTMKESLPYRNYKEGYKLFIDLFRDMNISDDGINMNFFAIKRETYELTGAQDKVYETTTPFEKDVEKRNVSIIHISHGDSVTKTDNQKTFKEFIKYWYDCFTVRSSHKGLKRMLLFLLAFHLFYFFLVFTWNWYNPILYIIVQFSLFMVTRDYSKHHFLQYLITPLYMLFFDGVLAVGTYKRIKHALSEKKAKKEAIPSTIENEEEG